MQNLKRINLGWVECAKAVDDVPMRRATYRGSTPSSGYNGGIISEIVINSSNRRRLHHKSKHNGVNGTQDGYIVVNSTWVVLRMDEDGYHSVYGASTVGKAGSHADPPFFD